MKIDNRVLELMKEQGLDTKDEILVINIAIIYATAQQDLLKQQLKNMKGKND